MKITYIRWRDAMSEEAAEPSTSATARLVELQEVGFLIHETEEAVCIGMELEGDNTSAPGRWRLHVPKVNIVERRDVDFGRAFPRRRKA